MKLGLLFRANAVKILRWSAGVVKRIFELLERPNHKGLKMRIKRSPAHSIAQHHRGPAGANEARSGSSSSACNGIYI
jgi:hypothetical protein